MTPLLTGVFASQITGKLITPTVDNGAMFPIQMVNVGSAGASTITFSNIPDTYKHLQIRAIYNLAGDDNLRLQLNGSTNSSYYHYLYAPGSGSPVSGSTSGNLFTIQWGAKTSTYYGLVTDILDYTSNSKNKTIRTLGGVDYNGVSNYGGVYLSSNLYATTSPITSLTISSPTYNFLQYSKFALYGTKG